MPPQKPSRRIQAFTIIEIMTSVAVIGALLTIVTMGFARSRATAQTNACIRNLRLIDDVKQNWASDNKQPTTATPSTAALTLYFQGGRFPVCPAGGTYTIRTVAQKPICSLRAQGHKY